MMAEKLKLHICAVVFAAVFFAVTAAGLEIGGIKIDDSDQKVTLKKEMGSWVMSSKGTNKKIPILNLDWNVGNAVFGLRHDQDGPYGCGIGLKNPTPHNWYQSDAFTLVLDGKAFKTGTVSNEKVEIFEEGRTARAVISWSNEIADVSYEFTGVYKTRFLYLTVRIRPKDGKKLKTQFKLHGFVGGYTRKKYYPLEVLAGKKTASLKPNERFISEPGETNSILLYRSAETETEGRYRGGCGVIMAPESKCKATVIHGWGSTVELDFPDGTEVFRLGLCEVDRTNASEHFSKWLELGMKGFQYIRRGDEK